MFFRKLFVSVFLTLLLLGNGGWFTLSKNGLYQKLEKKWTGYLFINIAPVDFKFKDWTFMVKGMIRF
jgi:hypothetical protein